MAAFQTRNPMHRSHEFLARVAIEVCDGVLIHQVLGALKEGDIPADVRVRAIDWLVANHFPEAGRFRPATPSRCATPAPGRRCCTRCSARISGVRIWWWGAIMPGSATITGRTTRTVSSTRSAMTVSRSGP